MLDAVLVKQPHAGASSDGGFIGHDEIAFVSAVLAHAPGLYSLICSSNPGAVRRPYYFPASESVL